MYRHRLRRVVAPRGRWGVAASMGARSRNQPSYSPFSIDSVVPSCASSLILESDSEVKVGRWSEMIAGTFGLLRITREPDAQTGGSLLTHTAMRRYEVRFSFRKQEAKPSVLRKFCRLPPPNTACCKCNGGELRGDLIEIQFLVSTMSNGRSRKEPLENGGP